MSNQVSYRDLYTKLVRAIRRENRLGLKQQEALISVLDGVLTQAFEAKPQKVRHTDKVVKSKQVSTPVYGSQEPVKTVVKKENGHKYRIVAGKRVRITKERVDLSTGISGVNTGLLQTLKSTK